MDMKLIEQRAQILKTLSHPHRLCIVGGLRGGGCSVGEIQKQLGISQSAVSQHLAKLKASGIIAGTRNGREVIYEVTDLLAAEISDIITKGSGLCENNKKRKEGQE